MIPVFLAVLLTVAQDTSTIDRGVRIGIIYRPGVRPGMVMLPRKGMGLDSVRAIVARDLDYSDRTSSSALNYPLYQALGADFALDITASADTTVGTLHDIAAAGVRRAVRA